METRCACRGAVIGVLAALMLGPWAWAEDEAADAPETEATRVESLDAASGMSSDSSEADASVGATRVSRLQYLMDYATEAQARMTRDVADYTCTLVKRERVEGRLTNYQFMNMKVRHERLADGQVAVPFSVYLQFLGPDKLKGREVLYVANQFNGDLIARRGGRGGSPNLTVQLDPTSPLAMEGNRYPITQIGFLNLTQLLIEVLEDELRTGDGEVKFFPDAKFEGRKCTHFRLTHHQRRPDLRYHMAELSVDDELGIPIYFRSFDWPVEEGKPPRLLEEYAYKDVKLNVGLTDRDFDVNNEQYHFQLKETAPIAVLDGPALPSLETNTLPSQTATPPADAESTPRSAPDRPGTTKNGFTR